MVTAVNKRCGLMFRRMLFSGLIS